MFDTQIGGFENQIFFTLLTWQDTIRNQKNSPFSHWNIWGRRSFLLHLSLHWYKFQCSLFLGITTLDLSQLYYWRTNALIHIFIWKHNVYKQIPHSIIVERKMLDKWGKWGVRERGGDNWKFNLRVIEKMRLRGVCERSITVDWNCQLIQTR